MSLVYNIKRENLKNLVHLDTSSVLKKDINQSYSNFIKKKEINIEQNIKDDDSSVIVEDLTTQDIHQNVINTTNKLKHIENEKKPKLVINNTAPTNKTKDAGERPAGGFTYCS